LGCPSGRPRPPQTLNGFGTYVRKFSVSSGYSVNKDMTPIKLPPELISLVHHIELNKAGWWEKGVQRCVIAAIWLSGEALTPAAVGEELKARFSMSIAPALVAEQVRLLCESGTLVTLPGGKLKISEQASTDFEKCIEEAEHIEEQARTRFDLLLTNSCPGMDKAIVWKDLNEKLLVPLIHGVGAKTYDLISGTDSVADKTPALGQFLVEYPEETRLPLRNTVVSFLDPKDAAVRSYILRQLNAYFLVEAGSLQDSTLAAITKASQRPPSFAIFLDTNFLFSILELHENPSNEAAQFLIKLLADLGAKVSCKLYVFPNTLDEIKGVIAFHRDILSGLDLKPNLAEAALDAGLSGVAQKFVETARKTGAPLKSADYFAPYLTDLIPILRKRNIEFFNQKVDEYTLRQDVIDDLMQQLEFERRFGKKAKTYEQLEHDMVLWHFVTDKRPAHFESPLEAKYWIVTVDYHFLGFDSFKRGGQPGKIPVCLHPTALIQMLQFWVPRTPAFDEAILGSLRWPFLVQEFDVNAERVTIRILEVLSRLENAGDLPADVLTSILLNDALRQKLALERNVEKHIELVKEALVEENERVRTQLEKERAETERLRSAVAANSQKVEDLERAKSDRQSQLANAQQDLENSEKTRRDLEQKLGQVERELAETKRNADQRRGRRSFAVGSLLFLLLLELVFSALAYITKWHWGYLRTLISAWSIGFGVWVWLADYLGQQKTIIKAWAPYTHFHRITKWIYGALATELLGHALWEALKRYF
jgi:hypothetical protein